MPSAVDKVKRHDVISWDGAVAAPGEEPSKVRHVALVLTVRKGKDGRRARVQFTAPGGLADVVLEDLPSLAVEDGGEWESPAPPPPPEKRPELALTDDPETSPYGA